MSKKLEHCTTKLMEVQESKNEHCTMAQDCAGGSKRYQYDKQQQLIVLYILLYQWKRCILLVQL